MKHLVLLACIAFWITMGSVWIAQWPSDKGPPPEEATSSSIPDTGQLPWDEIAQHASAASCWLVIEGMVYDVTSYIGQHPSDPETILRYCGKEATEAFNTKDRGRPHSGYAWRLLERYRLGVVAEE